MTDMLKMWASFFDKVEGQNPPNKEKHDALRAAFLAGYMAGSGAQWRAAEAYQARCTKQIRRLMEEEHIQ